MGPTFALDAATLRRNAASWQAYAGVPIRAVIKSDGYGWGFERIIRALDDVVAGYFVSDADEFVRVRELTQNPIATLADVAPDRIPQVLDADGIPSVSSLAGIALAGKWADVRARSARIRFGIRTAIGWSGVDPEKIARFAEELARRPIAIECWTHLTDPSLRAEQLRAFEKALNVLVRAGVNVVATDVASSAPLATGVWAGTHARVGAALFGFRFGADIAVASALRASAPIVSVEPASGQRIGYGVERAPTSGFLIVVRCGYGDGFPRFRNPGAGLLAAGMQFATFHTREIPTAGAFSILGATTDLDSLMNGTDVVPHELVVALGRASRTPPSLERAT